MAEAVSSVITALGIERFGVFGTDAGAYVATSLASFDAARVVGLHLQLGGVSITQKARAALTGHDDLTDAERQALADLEHYEKVDSGYALLNGTKPLTLAFALTDSPVGQAAWILEKFHSWTGADGDGGSPPFGAVAVDDALAIVSTYWFTRTAGSAARFYADAGATLARDGLPRVEKPTGCAVFPSDIVRPSRRWAERSYPNIVRWTEMPAGGHFGALEVPGLLAADLRAFFGQLRRPRPTGSTS
jgi:pimeloyl-ACP methyl ester carboxylesterase